MRQIILDTETTGLEPKQGHRIIEVGCVEIINRRFTGNNFHEYINPLRDIDEGAMAVHGISNEDLADKPIYEDIAESLYEYLEGAEVIIHNAPFDVGFINHEYALMGSEHTDMSSWCDVVDTLQMARKLFPGQRNSLDALCKRYDIDNSRRELHGALLDSEILGDVYLAMTGGQNSLFSAENMEQKSQHQQPIDPNRPRLKIIKPNEEEDRLHQERLAFIKKSASGHCLWADMTTTESE
mgnify:CR=1 FL=1